VLLADRDSPLPASAQGAFQGRAIYRRGALKHIRGDTRGIFSPGWQCADCRSTGSRDNGATFGLQRGLFPVIRLPKGARHGKKPSKKANRGRLEVIISHPGGLRETSRSARLLLPKKAISSANTLDPQNRRSSGMALLVGPTTLFCVQEKGRGRTAARDTWTGGGPGSTRSGSESKKRPGAGSFHQAGIGGAGRAFCTWDPGERPNHPGYFSLPS